MQWIEREMREKMSTIDRNQDEYQAMRLRSSKTKTKNFKSENQKKKSPFSTRKMNNFSGSPHQDDKTEVEKMMETVMACLEDTRSIAELTSLLNYANTPLEEFRVNA